MLHFLFLLILAPVDNSKATPSEDSVFIYNLYKDNIATLQKIKDSNQWHLLQDSLDAQTSCALRRLRLHNKQQYKPAKYFDRRGFGEAYYYPKPGDASGEHTFTLAESGERTFSTPKSEGGTFSVILQQTKFMLDDTGKTKVPYIERLYFDDDNKLLKIEKLDPAKFEMGLYVVMR
jgi:hypothetical protein